MTCAGLVMMQGGDRILETPVTMFAFSLQLIALFGQSMITATVSER